MARVDFFEVQGRRWDLALCRCVGEAYEAGLRVYVRAESEAEARSLDELLWSFQEDSFVPHGLWQGETECEEAVAIGWSAGNPNAATCLALAADVAADQLVGFDRVIDLAPLDLADRLARARRRYRSFREEGHEVVFHPSGEKRGRPGGASG